MFRLNTQVRLIVLEDIKNPKISIEPMTVIMKEDHNLLRNLQTITV